MTSLQEQQREKIMVAGDCHANLKHVKNTLIKRCVAEGITTIVQVGDLGFVWKNREGVLSGDLDVLNGFLSMAGITMYALMGNHEDYELLAEMGITEDDDEPKPIRSNIIHLPRG